MKALKQRTVWTGILFLLLFVLSLWRLYDIQVVKGSDYTEKLKDITTRTEAVDAPRGRIFDCHGELLAQTRTCYYASASVRSMPKENEDKNRVLSRLLSILETYDISFVNQVPVAVKEDHYIYSGSSGDIITFKKNIFSKNDDEMLSEKESAMDADALMAYICGKDFFDISGHGPTRTLKIAALRYLLYMHRYYPSTDVRLSSVLSEEGIAYITEHGNELTGISMEKSFERYYPDSKYFSNITGYVGLISAEEYEDADKSCYSAKDRIGKAGLEKAFESRLKGVSGCYTYEVGYDGSMAASCLALAPSAGNDLHLTIDKSLQMKVYDLVEEKLSGIILSRFVRNKDKAPDVSWLTDAEDIVYGLIKNRVIDVSDLLPKAYDEDHVAAQKTFYTLARDSGVGLNDILKRLYTQKVLTMDEDYEKLCAGNISAYDFLYKKIYTIALTPELLGQYPCSAACVVTDVRSGKVKALVSYPGFDANRISEYNYFNMLINLKSSPMFDKTTQMVMAPGSIFKMVTTAAALELGVVQPDTEIYDRLVFDKISPSPSCWSKQSHGSINISQALATSCNYFFYNIGYRLGLTDKNGYVSGQGLKILRTYADMFGLTKKSGIELGEASPEFSDESAVLSAIGQGTHSYTPVVLARYITALASKGNVYKLSLTEPLSVKRVQSQEKSALLGRVNLSETTWQAIYEGMLNVCAPGNYGDVFGELSVRCAGKSGTSQVNAYEPNHSLFAGFAPFENPEYAVTVIIPNGYSSDNAVDVFRDVIALCCGEPLYNKRNSESTSGERTAAMPYNYTDQKAYLDYLSD